MVMAMVDRAIFRPRWGFGRKQVIVAGGAEGEVVWGRRWDDGTMDDFSARPVSGFRAGSCSDRRPGLEGAGLMEMTTNQGMKRIVVTKVGRGGEDGVLGGEGMGKWEGVEDGANLARSESWFPICVNLCSRPDHRPGLEGAGL